MKYGIALSLLIFISSISISQGTDNRFKLKTSFAIGGTDDRIFGLPESYTAEVMQWNRDKTLPSMYFDVGLEYNFLERGKLAFKIGLNYAFEWNNSRRNYNHCIIQGNPCFRVLLFVVGYSYHLLGTSFTLDYTIFNLPKGHIKIGVGISPKLRFLTYYDSEYKYLWKLDYLFTEITPQISLALPSFEIGFYVRGWQHRKVDRGIYPSSPGGGAYSFLMKDYMNINPWKIGIFVKQDLPFLKSKSNLDEIE
jgi:hypothetical protein